MATKQEIMEALLASKEKAQNRGTKTQSSGGDHASYPFWQADIGQTVTLRFLPDGDSDNTYFWVPREVIKMPFDGVEGGDYPTSKQVTVTVPCMHMWGEVCPVQAATKSWWKTDKEETARIYWKKKSYIFQGFVVASPIEEDVIPENPIRRFVINPSIFQIIEKSLMDPEMEDMPTDYVGGVDFRIQKTKQGEYANYSSSDWSRKTRSLSEAELIAIEQYKLFNLKEYLGRRPDADEILAIKAMFDDSLAGRPFDMASFGKYYRPYGDNEEGSTPIRQAQSRIETVAKAVVQEAAAPVAEASETAPAASASTANAHEILERIKNRTMNKA